MADKADVKGFCETLECDWVITTPRKCTRNLQYYSKWTHTNT